MGDVDDPVRYVRENGLVSEDEFIERFGRTELSLLTPDPLKFSHMEGVVYHPDDAERGQ